MLPLFEMLANANQGQGIEALSRQFGLSQAQATAALEALLPAFSHGLKRNASDPYGVAAFMNAMATGQHARYFEDASRAFTPAGKAEGEDILSQLFGSKELSRAVAAQAAQATGIGQEIFKQMLPGLAAMIMGGLFKQSAGQFFPGFQPQPDNPLAAMMGEMMRQTAAMAQAPKSPQPANPFDNPFGKALEGIFGRPPEPEKPKPPVNPFTGNPFARVFEDMMRGGKPQEPTPEPEPPANPGGRARNAYDDLFGQMFETGRQQREDYQRSMERIFEQFGGGTAKRE